LTKKLVASVTAALSLSLFGVAAAPPQEAQAALTFNCPNADQLPRPYNLVDRCPVSTVDYNTTFIGEMTGGESYCDPLRHTTHTQRVRVVGDYESADGGKFHIRSIGIRYLAGTEPWAYYNVSVVDGNGQHFQRSWNNYESLIWYDGAGRDVNNTTNLTPPASFSPVFGRNGYIDVFVYPHFYKNPTAPAGQICTGDYVVLRLLRP
jgi:hypothetical protein